MPAFEIGAEVVSTVNPLYVWKVVKATDKTIDVLPVRTSPLHSQPNYAGFKQKIARDQDAAIFIPYDITDGSLERGGKLWTVVNGRRTA